jgi:hypothetical protein
VVTAVSDLQTFLGRLTHLDRDAVVRLRPARPGWTALWARLPWGVLVTREVSGAPVSGDITVGAAALLGGGGAPRSGAGGASQPAGTGGLPPRRDHDWRWPLPPPGGAVLEEIPPSRLREVSAAAAGTLREVTETGLAGRPVGVRMLREALLDHIAVVVEGGGERLEVPQRLVQAVVRMGFLGADDAPVRVTRADRWVGLAARYGTGWLPPRSGPLALRPLRPAGE